MKFKVAKNKFAVGDKVVGVKDWAKGYSGVIVGIHKNGHVQVLFSNWTNSTGGYVSDSDYHSIYRYEMLRPFTPLDEALS